MISFIVTTYNSQDVIARCLGSILNQRVKKEIIVCDDCSSDYTLDLCYKMGVDSIFVNEKNSGGPSWGRNVGLKEMQGDYFCFMDADDELLPGSIWKLILHPRDFNNINVIYGDYIYKSENKEYIVGNGKYEYYAPNVIFEKFLSQDKGKFCLPMITGTLISANLKHIRFEEVFGLSDLDYMLKLTENQTAVKIEKPVFIRHVYGGNLSINNRARKVMYYYSSMFLENYYEKYPKETTKGLKKLAGTKARYHYQVGQMGMARFFFSRANKSLKNILYYLTTFYGSKFVLKHFRISGT